MDSTNIQVSEPKVDAEGLGDFDLTRLKNTVVLRLIFNTYLFKIDTIGQFLVNFIKLRSLRQQTLFK